MNQNLYEFLTKISVPKLAEFFVFLIFLNECCFGMFLDESQKNSCCPFLSVKIKEFRGSFRLWLTNVVIKLWIIETYNSSDKVHPIKCKFFDLIIDFIMSSLP